MGLLADRPEFFWKRGMAAAHGNHRLTEAGHKLAEAPKFRLREILEVFKFLH